MAIRGSGRTVMEREHTGVRPRAKESTRSVERDAVAASTIPQGAVTQESHPYRTILACGLNDDSA